MSPKVCSATIIRAEVVGVRIEASEVNPEGEGQGRVLRRRLSLETVADRRPWWVKKRERPKYEVDEAVYGRFDQSYTAFAIVARELEGSRGADLGAGGGVRQDKYGRAFLNERVLKGRPGWELRDVALNEGANTVDNGVASVLYSWYPLQARRPVDFGVERHQSSPAENSRLVKVAGRFYGAVDVGVALLDRRHVYTHDRQGRPIVFEDVDEPIVEENRRVIPERCRWVVVVAIGESEEAIARAPDTVSAAAVSLGYSLMAFVAGSLAEFIRALGYSAIPAGNDTVVSVPIAIEAGLGEMSRMGILITPELGPRVRLATVITDLPMAPDHPIDFGAQEFCASCVKCARLCPSGSISAEREPSYNVTGEWNSPGHRAWYVNGYTCLKYWGKVGTGCGTCVRVCPYGKRQSVWHRLVMSTIAVTPWFNGLFARADDWLGAGRRRDPDEWWATTPGPFGSD